MQYMFRVIRKVYFRHWLTACSVLLAMVVAIALTETANAGAAHSIITALESWHAVGGLVVVGVVWLIVYMRSKAAVLLGTLGAVYALFWGVWRVSDMMTGVGISQSVIYHLFSGTEGADHSKFLSEIIVAAAFLALALFILFLSVGYGWRGWGGHRSVSAAATRRAGIGHTLWPLALGVLLVGAGWLVSPWHRDIVALANSYSRLDSGEEQRLQALYRVEPRAVKRDRNLVVLYVESLESTYFDESIFPGLLPNLRRQREKALSFSGIEQTPGTGWTIAGLVNTQCGLPLATPGAGVNEMGRVQYFLPKATCLAEHLVDNGFHTVFMGGSSGEFAGKTRFLEQHGFEVVRDKAYFENAATEETVFSGWGAYDDQLLDGVHEEFVHLSQQEAPFALFALTIDTHYPHGYISPSCSGREFEYGNGQIKTLNALHCADYLVSRFIERITSSPYYENTTLVVLSDHLAMVNDAQVLLDRAEKRENLLMVFDEELAAEERAVQGSMLDVGATLLDLLGADETRLGFGRSLLEPAPGREGAYTADYHASGDVTDYLSFSRGLWDMPSVVGRIKSDGNGGVMLGNTLLEAPFFSVLDSENRVVELYFYDFSGRLDRLSQGARYLYALKCESARQAPSGMCLVSGIKGMGEKVFTAPEFIEGVRVAQIY